MTPVARTTAAAAVAAALAWWTNRGIGFELAPTLGVWALGRLIVTAPLTLTVINVTERSTV